MLTATAKRIGCGVDQSLCGRRERPFIPKWASLFLGPQACYSVNLVGALPGCEVFFSRSSRYYLWLRASAPSSVNICGFGVDRLASRHADRRCV